MVRRALEGEVERDLEPEPLGFARGSVAKSSSVPSSACTLLWPPSGAADRPRRAGIRRRGLQAVVAALAVTAADRMNRRQIHDVEAHLGDVREAARRRRERAVARRRLGRRAREELVPRAEARERPLDDDLERRVVNGLERAVRAPRP